MRRTRYVIVWNITKNGTRADNVSFQNLGGIADINKIIFKMQLCCNTFRARGFDKAIP